MTSPTEVEHYAIARTVALEKTANLGQYTGSIARRAWKKVDFTTPAQTTRELFEELSMTPEQRQIMLTVIGDYAADQGLFTKDVEFVKKQSREFDQDTVVFAHLNGQPFSWDDNQGAADAVIAGLPQDFTTGLMPPDADLATIRTQLQVDHLTAEAYRTRLTTAGENSLAHTLEYRLDHSSPGSLNRRGVLYDTVREARLRLLRKHLKDGPLTEVQLRAKLAEDQEQLLGSLRVDGALGNTFGLTQGNLQEAFAQTDAEIFSLAEQAGIGVGLSENQRNLYLSRLQAAKACYEHNKDDEITTEITRLDEVIRAQETRLQELTEQRERKSTDRDITRPDEVELSDGFFELLEHSKTANVARKEQLEAGRDALRDLNAAAPAGLDDAITALQGANDATTRARLNAARLDALDQQLQKVPGVAEAMDFSEWSNLVHERQNTLVEKQLEALSDANIIANVSFAGANTFALIRGDTIAAEDTVAQFGLAKDGGSYDDAATVNAYDTAVNERATHGYNRVLSSTIEDYRQDLSKQADHWEITKSIKGYANDVALDLKVLNRDVRAQSLIMSGLASKLKHGHLSTTERQDILMQFQQANARLVQSAAKIQATYEHAWKSSDKALQAAVFSATPTPVEDYQRACRAAELGKNPAYARLAKEHKVNISGSLAAEANSWREACDVITHPETGAEATLVKGENIAAVYEALSANAELAIAPAASDDDAAILAAKTAAINAVLADQTKRDAALATLQASDLEAIKRAATQLEQLPQLEHARDMAQNGASTLSDANRDLANDHAKKYKPADHNGLTKELEKGTLFTLEVASGSRSFSMTDIINMFQREEFSDMPRSQIAKVLKDVFANCGKLNRSQNVLKYVEAIQRLRAMRKQQKTGASKQLPSLAQVQNMSRAGITARAGG